MRNTVFLFFVNYNNNIIHKLFIIVFIIIHDESAKFNIIVSITHGEGPGKNTFGIWGEFPAYRPH